MIGDRIRRSGEAEGAEDEKEVEQYGGDDPRDPEGCNAKDSNLVEWNGPDDPENPQNWSKGYKCFVTGICAIITFNVYASLLFHP